MEEFRFASGDAKQLRCQECGEVVGQWWGDSEKQPGAEQNTTVLCHGCALIAEAEAVTRDA
jgi:hypothetical protein